MSGLMPVPALAALPVAAAAPDLRLLFLVNLAALVAVVLFATGVIYLVLRRSYRRRVEEQKLAAIGTATARILHQIKNPLQTILLHTDLLQDPRVGGEAESQAELCEAIAGEAQRLAAMLNELSSFAAGARRHFELEPVPLHDLLRELARREAREGSLRVDAARVDEATVLADPYYLRQALENLISNARDAMEGQEEARLTLSLERAGETAVVGVADSGPGIPADRVESVFQPFVSSKSQGMGLGLPISKEIVEGHGGRIEVRSRPGQGTRFRVLLPLHSARAAAEPRITHREGVA